MKTLQHHLLGTYFIVRTGHLALASITSNTKGGPRIVRWVLELQQFNMRCSTEPAGRMEMLTYSLDDYWRNMRSTTVFFPEKKTGGGVGHPTPGY